MENTIRKAYRFMCYAFAVLFLYSLLQLKIDITRKEWQGGYSTITDYDYAKLQDAEAPCGVKETYRIKVNNVSGEYHHLLVYTLHQNLRILVDGECVYSVEGTDDILSWKSPGRLWNDVRLTEKANGKHIILELTPVYESAVGKVPTIYFGAKTDIHLKIIRDDALVLFMCVLIIIAGLVFTTATLSNKENDFNKETFKLLGICSLLVGVWKMVDTGAMGLLDIKYPVFSLVPYWALMLLGVPCILVVKNMLRDEESVWWQIPCFISLGEMLFVIILQFLSIADFKETLVFTHALLAISILIAAIMIGKKVTSVGLNKEMSLTLLCAASCLFWVVTDLVSYYHSGGSKTSAYGMLGFIGYVIALSWSTMHDARELMNVGMQARQYERKAFHDQLTGFYNRAAFAEYIGNEEFVPEDFIVAEFDLNNLKICNDTLGHEKGDVYIRESARMIRECFGAIGQCYRIGGDEFIVLITRSTKEDCAKRLEELKEKVKEFNHNGTGIRMGIACGYEEFDAELDASIEDTAKRADALMYQEKARMKAQDA